MGCFCVFSLFVFAVFSFHLNETIYWVANAVKFQIREQSDLYYNYNNIRGLKSYCILIGKGVTFSGDHPSFPLQYDGSSKIDSFFSLLFSWFRYSFRLWASDWRFSVSIISRTWFWIREFRWSKLFYSDSDFFFQSSSSILPIWISKLNPFVLSVNSFPPIWF